MSAVLQVGLETAGAAFCSREKEWLYVDSILRPPKRQVAAEEKDHKRTSFGEGQNVA
jgi:hypothetical protein